MVSCHVSHDRRPMDAERVRHRVDGLTIVAPMDELGDVVVGQPSLVLHHRVCPASGDRASEHDRQKSRHCEEGVAGVRKPSLKVHKCSLAHVLPRELVGGWFRCK